MDLLGGLPDGTRVPQNVSARIKTEMNGASASASSNTPDPLIRRLEEINRSMMFWTADALTMSCGTVTLDLKLGKVLLVWNRKLQIFQLPKGRRNIEVGLEPPN